MSLEHILNAMRAEVASQIQDIYRTADEQSARVAAAAHDQAAAIRARHKVRAEQRLAEQAARLDNHARLEAARRTAATRHELLELAFQGAEQALAEIRQSPRYPAVLSALVREAVTGLEGDLVTEVDVHDVALTRSAFAELGIAPEVRVRDTPLGGLVVMSADRRVIVANTLASRLDHARGPLRGPVAAILSGCGTSENEWKPTMTMPTPA